MADDLRVSVYDDDLRIVVEGAIGINGIDGEDGEGVLPGGLTGQILTKASDIDYDTLWDNPAAGVPNDGTTGQLLSKASSDPYDTIWIDPSETDLSNYAQLDAANVFTANNSFTSIVMPEGSPIYMGTAPDGYVMLKYYDGGLAAVNPRWGAALRIYGVGIDDPDTIVNGQALVIQHDTIDSFFINTQKYGTSPEARLWIQGWNLGSASDPHLVAWSDNTQDIGALIASPYKGRIRNIYAATSVNTPTLNMPVDTARIKLGATVGNEAILEYESGWFVIRNDTIGGGLYIYSEGANATSPSGSFGLISVGEGYFQIATSSWGGAPPAELSINNWSFGTLTASHIRPYGDNVFDIGMLTPASGYGNPRNIYAATGLYEAGVALASKYARLAVASTFTAAQTITLSGALAVPLTLVSTSADALSGPFLDLRRESATPAVNDLIGAIRFIGRDSLNADRLYAQIDVAILDPVDASQDARFGIRTMRASALGYVVQFGPGVAVGSAVDQGVNTLNAPTLYENAVALASKYAALAAAAFTGTVSFAVSPTAPTPTAGDNTLKLATTAFVTTAVAAGGGGALDATLVALAALDATAGYVEQTGADAFTKRATNAFAYLATPNVFTATNSFPAITMPSDAATISMGAASDSVFSYYPGGFSIHSNLVGWGTGISLYGVNTNPTSTNGSYLEIYSGIEGGIPFFNLAASKLGTTLEPEMYLNQWNFSSYTDSHLRTYGNNLFDIGIATPTGTLGSPRNIYAATGLYEAGVALSAKYARLAVANTFTAAQTIASGTLTTSVPALNITQTWNLVGTTFTGILATITDTASAAASLLIDLKVGATSKFQVRKDGRIATATSFSPSIDMGTILAGLMLVGRIDTAVTYAGMGNSGTDFGVYLQASASLIWTSSTTNAGAATKDLFVVRDAANTLALRNAANAQTFNIYNTYTSASVYERLAIAWASGICTISTQMLGATMRALNIYAGVGQTLGLGGNGAVQWTISNAGHISATDNTYDIGGAASGRPRNVYVGTAIYEAGVALASKYAQLAAANTFTFTQTFGAANAITAYRSAAHNYIHHNADSGKEAMHCWGGSIAAAGPAATRWAMGKDPTAEVTGDAGYVGSDFCLWAMGGASAASEVIVGQVFGVARSTQILNFIKSPTAPTPTAGDNTTKLATTEFVTTAVAGGGGGGGQPLDATLTAFAAITGAADQFPYFTAADVFSTATITSAARTVLDDTTVAAMLTTMGGAPLASPSFTGTVTAATGFTATTGNITATTGNITATGGGINCNGGVLSVNRLNDASNAELAITTDNTGYTGHIRFSSGFYPRWYMGKNATAETGSNAGADFFLDAYDDSTGASLGNVFIAKRSTRVVDFAFTPTVAGAALSTIFQPAGSYELLGEVAGVNTQASSYTLVLADKGKVVEMNNASANNLTIPLNSSVAFPINTRIDISQIGAGQTTIVPTGGVTIRQRETKLKLAGQYAGASLYQRAIDEWVLFGDLST